MVIRKVVRKPEEETELKRIRLEKKVENQRNRRRNKTYTAVQSTSNDQSVRTLEIQPEVVFDQEIVVPRQRSFQLEEELIALNFRDIELHLRVELPTNHTHQQQLFRVQQREEGNRFFAGTIDNVQEYYGVVSPAQTELFYLRLLLLKVKGAKSFEDVRTVNGQVCESFIATCLALGLIEDDDEWRRAMEESAIWMKPGLLRRLFVRILVHCQRMHLENLWEEFNEKMAEDYARHIGLQRAQRKAYTQIVCMLINENSNISRFSAMEQIEISDDDERDISPSQFVEIGIQQYEQLNDTRRVFVDAVLSAIDNNNDEQNCFCINGPGGSGKTFTYTTLSNLVRGREKCISAMAFTGITVILLPEGKTVHKTFGLPVPLYADSTSSIKVQSKQGEYLKHVDLPIWDEAPMAPRHALEVADRRLQDIMNGNKPLGGKVIVLGGDFRQLLPVKVQGTRSETVNLSIQYSALWSHFSKYALTQNMRVLSNEVEFAKCLLDGGDGFLNDADDNLQVPKRCMAPANQDIVEDTYGQLARAKRLKNVTERAILSARNFDVDEISWRVMDLFDKNTERLYTSVDSAENCGNNDQINETILPENLNTLSPLSLPPHELRLRKYGIIILTRNLSVNEGQRYKIDDFRIGLHSIAL